MNSNNWTFFDELSNTDNYSFYRNQVWLAKDQDVLKELSILRNAQDDFNYHLIEKEVANKIEIVINELKKRWLETK